MKRLHHHQVGIARGEEVLFSDFEDNGQMWTGSGPRETRRRVTFSEAFVDAPVVQVNLAMWDADHLSNQRLDVKAENVGADGFEIVFRTWGDSRVARVRAAWLAIGEVRHDENWELY